MLVPVAARLVENCYTPFYLPISFSHRGHAFDLFVALLNSQFLSRTKKVSKQSRVTRLRNVADSTQCSC